MLSLSLSFIRLKCKINLWNYKKNNLIYEFIKLLNKFLMFIKLYKLIFDIFYISSININNNLLY